jgi:hypothetical protein
MRVAISCLLFVIVHDTYLPLAVARESGVKIIDRVAGLKDPEKGRIKHKS